jgi:hypothetical protein
VGHTWDGWRSAGEPAGARHDPARFHALIGSRRLTESAPRQTGAGSVIPFELAYAPGVIYDLALSEAAVRLFVLLNVARVAGSPTASTDS